MFNHRSVLSTPDSGGLGLGPLFFTDSRLSWCKDTLVRSLLEHLPRHTGLLYSTRLLRENLATIASFCGSLHLYAVPMLLAAKEGKAAFFDYPLTWFSADAKTDGAWESHEKVFNGLWQFLERLHAVLPPDHARWAEAGFMKHYLGDKAWLRALLSAHVSLPTEAAIRASLRRLAGAAA